MKCKFPSIKVNAENKPDENDSFRYQYRINNKLILGPLITGDFHSILALFRDVVL